MFVFAFGVFADTARLITLKLMAKYDLIEFSPKIAIRILLLL